MAIDPLVPANLDFTPTDEIARTVKDYLASALIDQAEIPDRNGPEPYRVSRPVLSAVYRFDGSPEDAVLVGLERRAETNSGLPFAVVGFERTVQRLTALSGSPKIHALPFSIVLVFPGTMAGPAASGDAVTRAEQIEADAVALDTAADMVQFFVRPRFISPHAWGLSALEAGDMDPGRLAGIATPVNFRRIPYTFSRLVQN